VGLLVLSAGFLAVIYAPENPVFYIGGAAGPVLMETGAQPRGGPLQLMLNNNASNIITIGTNPCQSFLFPTKIHLEDRYSVTIKNQASAALCRVQNGVGLASKNLLGNDGIRVTCDPGWLIGGIVLFSGTLPPGMILQNNQQESLSVPSGATTSGWYFPTPVKNFTNYAVTVTQSPPGLSCTPSKNVGVALTPVIDVAITCQVVPTPAPPTKTE